MLRLRELRKQTNITMKEFGAKFGLAESTISHYENGNREPDYATLKKFADYFNVSTDYLLGNTDIQNYQKLDIPDELKDVKIAFHRGEFEDLTQDEVDKIAEFAKFVKSQRQEKEDEKK